MWMILTYTELIKFKTFEERFGYLSLSGFVAEETFGFDRYINQQFYHSKKWKSIRDSVILRDNGCDLAIDGREIYDGIVVHHMNPLTRNDIINETEMALDPEYLICTTHNTHNAIHYGDIGLLITTPIERRKNDTSPWIK